MMLDSYYDTCEKLKINFENEFEEQEKALKDIEEKNGRINTPYGRNAFTIILFIYGK